MGKLGKNDTQNMVSPILMSVYEILRKNIVALLCVSKHQFCVSTCVFTALL